MITPATFPNYLVYETELGGRKLKFETGKMAGLANGAVLVTYGETVVLCTATMAKAPRDGIDFFPLGVTSRRSCTPWAASPAPLCAARAVPARRPSWSPV